MRSSICISFMALFAVTLKGGAPSAPDEVILPSKTDQAIRTFDFHEAVYFPKDPQRGQLFIYLPGTFGHGPGALELSRYAALVGYHVIQIMYPDDIPASVARNDVDRTAFAKFRWAIIEGGSSPHLPTAITRSESIENRIIKLLIYLDRKHSKQNWKQFLDGDNIRWEKVAIAGMSQGGGHAALIATRYPVARVLCLGAPKDYNIRWKEPAGWYKPSVTPPNRFFTFNNIQDKQGANFAQQVENLSALGIDRINDTANVDTEMPPYRHAHSLFTNWPGTPVESQVAHGSVIVDGIFGPDGRPVFGRVWLYMLTEPTGAVSAGDKLVQGSVNGLGTSPGRLLTVRAQGLSNDLLAWWPADDNAVDAVSGLSARLNGVTFGPGKINQAFNFDGRASYVQANGPGAVNGPRTWAAWVYAEGSDLSMPIITAGTTGAGDFFGVGGTVGSCASSGRYRLYLDHWGSQCIVSGSAVKPGTWSHVAITFDGETVQFYINGAPAPAARGRMFSYGLSTIEIGGNTIGGTTTSPSFHGAIDEVKIYNRALTQSEIANQYLQ